jgi:hypothetical protein
MNGLTSLGCLTEDFIQEFSGSRIAFDLDMQIPGHDPKRRGVLSGTIHARELRDRIEKDMRAQGIEIQ